MRTRMKIDLVTIVFCAVAVMPQKGYASHIAGAEIYYQWVHDSTYQLFCRCDRACENGLLQPVSITVAACNSCDTNFIPVTLDVVGGLNNSKELVRLCPGNNTLCTDPNSMIPGYQEWLYSGYVSLPSRCDKWTFFYSDGSRNAAVSNIQAQNIFVVATLDNVDAQGNSSPILSAIPMPYSCINILQTVSFNAIDINHDSLVFYSIVPKVSGTCNILTDATYTAGYSASNPINSSSGLSVDSSTGQMTFTPMDQGKFQFAIEVDEYRHGHKIGSVIKDFQMVVASCSFGPPAVWASNVSGGYFLSSVGSTVVTAPFNPLSFNIYGQGVPASDTVTLAGSNISSAAGSTYTINGQDIGLFFWVPSINDVGDHIVSFSAGDSTCSSNKVIVDNTFYLTITVLPLLPDSSSCLSGAIGGSMDSSDVGRFIIGKDTIGALYSHLSNPAAVNSFKLYPDTIQLYIDSSYHIQEAGIMNTLHDANAKVTLFMDLNGNHQFDIPQERIWTAYTKAFQYYILDTTFKIPATAIIDSPVVMRLILNNDTGASAASDSACGTYISGETEDFIVIFRNAASAVKNLSNDSRISFYPNPNKGKFRMDLRCSNGVKELNVKISTITGQTILSKHYNNTGTQFSADIDISDVSKGLYFIETDADGQRNVSKIVVQ